MTDQGMIIARLRCIATTDHERGCEGRSYACSCGWDEESTAIATQAADLIEALSAPPSPDELSGNPGGLKAPPMGEALAWRWRFDTDAMWNYGPDEPGQFRFMQPVTIEPLYALAQPGSGGAGEGEKTAVDVTCPRCGALPSSACRTTAGYGARTHAGRFTAAGLVEDHETRQRAYDAVRRAEAIARQESFRRPQWFDKRAALASTPAIREASGDQ